MGASSVKKRVTVNVVIHLVLLVLVVICLFPIVMVVLNSFKTNQEIVSNPLAIPSVLHLENYISAWKYGEFARGFINSIKLSGCTILVILFCSTLAGYVLSGYRIKGSGFILAYFMMAITVPIQLFLFPLYYVYAKLNLLGNIPAISLILAALYMPLAVFLMRTFFLNVPSELEDAARIDGANTAQVIWHVMRPVVSPGLITVGTLVGLQSWNEYLISSTFLQGKKNYTATLGFLSMKGSYASNMPALMASAVILIAPVVVFFLFAQKYFVDGMVSGAVKG